MDLKIINRDYTILLTGQLISILGNIINGIAAMWVIYDVLGTGSKTGLLFGLSTIPAMILTPFIGNFVDMFNRKNLLFICDFIAGINTLILCVLTYKDLLTFFSSLIIFSMDSILFAIVAATRSSLIQNLVKQNEYLKANSINSLIQNLARISLPMVGAILIARFSPAACFMVDAVSFFIAAFLTLAINSYKFKPETRESFVKNFKAGIQYIKTNSQFLNFVFLLGIINFIGASETMLIRILIDKAKLHVDFFGFYKSFIAVGSILIAFIITKYKTGKKSNNDERKIMSSALALQSMGYLIICIGHKYLLLFGGLLLGFGETLFNVFFFSYMQTYIHKDFYGRVISLVFFVSQIAQPLSYWAFGSLVDIMSAYSIFFMGGVGLLIITFFFYRTSLKQTTPAEAINS